MENKTDRKPWYKKWWGVVLLVLLFPFTLTYLTLKQEKWSVTKKALIILFIWVFFIIASKSKSKYQNTSQYIENKPVAKQKEESLPTKIPTPTITILEITANQLVADFDKNKLAAEENYKKKMVKFSAYVKNISEDIMGTPYLSLQPTNEEYYFGTSIQCLFKSKSELLNVQNGQEVTVIGTISSMSLGTVLIRECQLK